MKKTNILLISLILFLLGCENSKTEKPHITIENTTEIFTPQNTTDENQTTKEESNDDQKTEYTSESIKETFTLNIKQNSTMLTIENKHISIDKAETPLILLSLFNTKSAQHRVEIPYLMELQKKYKNRLAIFSILVNQEEKEEVLKKFSQDFSNIYSFFTTKKENEHFVQTIMKVLEIKEKLTLPLTILYKEGNYYIHYEGPTPVEMIEHNIEEAIH